MKLSVSAYRAQASAHKKIRSNYQHQLSYGATNQAASARTPSDPAAVLPTLKPQQMSQRKKCRKDRQWMQERSRRLMTKVNSFRTSMEILSMIPSISFMVDRGQIEVGPSCSGASSSRMGPGHDSGSSAHSSVQHSLATSREDENDEDDDSSGRRSNGHGGSRFLAKRFRRVQGTTSTVSDSLEKIEFAAETPTSSGRKGGSQKWSNVRAVMALYSSLRKIKRTKSNQRWMKLRTTVQLSSAISTIQKKPPLKREDSFLKRFSTRQIPESQETLDTGEGEGEGEAGDGKVTGRRRRRTRRPQRPPKTVVNPDENFYFYWLMLLSGCVLYNLWTLIVRQSLPELQALSPEIWLACDTFTDLVFFLDVGVQFRTGYLEQGLMVYNSKKLAGHYLKSKSFILDLLALLPLDLLQVNLGSNPMLRFPRFLKIYRVYNYYYMVESRTVYPNLWRVFNLIHILLILAHWFGCFYYLLSEVEGFQGDWVYPYRPGEYATLTRKYLGSLYWSTLTLTTIGDLPTPETNAEYVFTIVSYLIGVFIFATIVGQVGNVITNRNANRLEFERLLDGAKTYMRHHKVPGGMKRRVLRWYDYSWSRGRIQGGGDINTALGLLPDKLKTELALHVNLSVLKKVTIFQECQPEFLHDLVLKMKAYIFTPGDSICRKGEVAREMFIIADGILEVISENGRVLTTMKAGDFFGEIGILNLDGFNKRTADVRSVGYSELFSLSREDVLAAMKDYPEAQEILQSLGKKRLMEAQRVARALRQPTSPGHDSSDNSTGKRIVDKLKSDVKGLKNVLRKSRRNTTRPEESLELQPLTQKFSGLRRQAKIDDSQELTTSVLHPHDAPVSPLGAGLPLLERLRLLKEKTEREERRNLMDAAPVHTQESQQSHVDSLNTVPTPINQNVPFFQRILLLKAKTEQQETTIQEKETVVTEVDAAPRPEVPRKPWAMLKNASLTTKDVNASSTGVRDSVPVKKPPQLAQSLVQLRQRTTKMYASVDDLSPEYCGLPFVKKLKILNERQKLAELEKAARSSSLDCTENAETEFDSYLTRSHSEPACAIEYARNLAKFNEIRQSRLPQEPLSPENETLERRKMKSILKKLSAGSRGGSCDATSITNQPAELRKLMRAPTIEGYAARHSKLSKSVTFNKYTLQSPPSEQSPVNQSLSESQEQSPLPSPNKLTFRPSSSGAGLLQMLQRPREDDLLYGIREVIQARLENMNSNFQREYLTMELEIQKRDEIISQLQARIQELEQRDDCGGDSTEHDASLEDDLDDDDAREDHPFMRDGSVDTVLTASSHNRRSWEEHSEEETLELQELPRSIMPQNVWKDDVAIDLETNSDSSGKSDNDYSSRRRRRRRRSRQNRSDSEDDDDQDIRDNEEDDDDDDDDDDGHNDWEVAMLAQELEAKRRSSENANPTS
ncbi:uncharacterized protein Cngl isoform X2 [Prorops nasuta]|uniref:uncharacterized protein Cngl isoform X2 n=1 Tax=Prorops nasuta TaxID=863751 RepID=UPI0034CED2C1